MLSTARNARHINRHVHLVNDQHLSWLISTPLQVKTKIIIMTIAVGDKIPEGEFGYIAVTEADDMEACQLPGKLNTSDFKGKKVVVFAVYVVHLI